MPTLRHKRGNLCFDGVMKSLVPVNPIGTTGTSGYAAANLAIPVLPGSRKGALSRFDLVPSGNIPSARFACKTTAALDSTSPPPASLLVSI